MLFFFHFHFFLSLLSLLLQLLVDCAVEVEVEKTRNRMNMTLHTKYERWFEYIWEMQPGSEVVLVRSTLDFIDDSEFAIVSTM